MADAPLSTSSAFTRARCGVERWLGLVEGDALGDNGFKPALDSGDQARFQRAAPLARQIGGVAGPAQQALHRARPALLFDLDQGLEFAQVVGVAQRVQNALHRVIRLPVIVNDDPADAREQTAAPGRDPIGGQQGRRGDVQPLGLAADPETGLVQVLDRRRLDALANSVGQFPEPRRAALAHPRDGRRNQRRAEQVRHQRGQTILGQKLAVRQVDDGGRDPGAVLDRRPDFLRKRRPGLMATVCATATLRPMLRDDEWPGLGQIENLTGTVARGHVRRQGRTTMPASFGKMIDGGVRIGNLAQRAALVTVLPTRLATRLLAQAPGPAPLLFLLSRRCLGQPVAGRRPGAVRAVQTKPALKFGKPGFKSRIRRAQRRILGHESPVLRQQARYDGFRSHRKLES